MKRLGGWLLTCGGALVAIGSVVFRHPAFIIINERFIAEAWLIQLFLGLAFFTVGILVVRRTT